MVVKRPGKVIPFSRSARAAPRTTLEASLVEAARCRHQAEALVVRALLESEGIPTVLRGHLVASIHPFSVGDLAEVAVLVHAADAARATAVLDRRPRPRLRPLP